MKEPFPSLLAQTDRQTQNQEAKKRAHLNPKHIYLSSSSVSFKIECRLFPSLPLPSLPWLFHIYFQRPELILHWLPPFPRKKQLSPSLSLCLSWVTSQKKEGGRKHFWLGKISCSPRRNIPNISHIPEQNRIE